MRQEGLDPHPERAWMEVAMYSTSAGDCVGPPRQTVLKREVLPTNHPILHETPQIASRFAHRGDCKCPRAAVWDGGPRDRGVPCEGGPGHQGDEHGERS